MGESPLADSVSSGRILATISPIRNAVELAGPGSCLKMRVQASWTVVMRLVEGPRWTGVPPLVLQRCQPFLSIGSTAISNKSGVRRTTYPRSAVWLDLRTTIRNNPPDCPLSSMVPRCYQTITAAFRRHLALELVPRITTDLILAQITLVIRTFHQSQRCLSTGP